MFGVAPVRVYVCRASYLVWLRCHPYLKPLRLNSSDKAVHGCGAFGNEGCVVSVKDHIEVSAWQAVAGPG